MPSYSWWETPFYGIGLKIYDLLAGKYGFGRSRILSREETLERLPNIQTDGLKHGVIYYDGQFDDTRLLIILHEPLPITMRHCSTMPESSKSPKIRTAS